MWWLFDRMIPAVAIVCFCIRLGNLMNSEIFGYPTTLPWGFEFVRSREWHQLYEGLPCHPTQIYEMLYCLVAGVTAWMMYHTYHYKKSGINNRSKLAYIFWHSFCSGVYEESAGCRRGGYDF